MVQVESTEHFGMKEVYFSFLAKGFDYKGPRRSTVSSPESILVTVSHYDLSSESLFDGPVRVLLEPGFTSG